MQKFLDGKKKYSAFIITVLVAVIPLFIQSPEAQKTMMDYVPSIAAALSGIIYMIIQGGVDKEKEKSLAATAQAALAVANGINNGTHAQPAQPQQPSQPVVETPPVQSHQESLPAPETLPVPFDPKAFHEDVLANVQATYKEVNQCTIFYKARDKGQVTDCQHISQAVDYWQYLVDLAVDAKDWLRGQTEKKAGQCGRSPEYYVFTRDFTATIRAANKLTELESSGINWKSKLMPFQRTLYNVGILAEQLINPG